MCVFLFCCASASPAPLWVSRASLRRERKRRVPGFASKFDSTRDTGRARVINSPRFQSLKYCPCTEPTLENCGTPALRFSEAVGFAIPFCPWHLVAWPATLQIILKNDAKWSFFEPRCNMFTQRLKKRRIVPGYFGLVHKLLVLGCSTFCVVTGCTWIASQFRSDLSA
jgi:hypothetical protein